MSEPRHNPSAGESPPRQPSSIRKVIVASLIGTSLEWYDFFIYGTAAALVFNKLFFPSFEPLVGTLLAFATYAVGFVARPLGGVVFGHYGDKIGRKNVLVVTLLLMGIATFLIGVLPTHATIGVWAPILLVFLRFLQGLGLGGEWGGAVLMTLESGDPQRRGLNASWPQVGVPIGLLLANGVLSLMGAITSNEAFLSWGWRVPFLLSGLLVIVGLWIRMTIAESPLFSEVEASRQQGRRPDRRGAAPLSQAGAAGDRCAGRGRRRLLHLRALRHDLCRHLPRTAEPVRPQRSVDRGGRAGDRNPLLRPSVGPVRAASDLSDRCHRVGDLGLRLLHPAGQPAVRADCAGGGRGVDLPRGDVRSTGLVHRRDVPDQGPLHGRLYGLPAGRHPWRRAGTDHLGRAARPVRHLGGRLGLRRGDAAGHDHLRLPRSGDIQDRSARRRRGAGPEA